MSRSSCPALVKAVQGGRIRQVRLLLHAGSNVDSTGDRKRSALTLACLLDDERGRRDITRMLLDQGANQTKQDDSRRIPIHYAAASGCQDIVALLLQDGEVDLNTRDSDGNTPLALAVSSGDYESVKRIVDELVKYHLSVDVPDNNNICPIVKAKLAKNRQVFFLLKQYSQIVSLQWRHHSISEDDNSTIGDRPRPSCESTTPLAVPQTPDEWQETRERYLSTKKQQDLELMATSSRPPSSRIDSTLPTNEKKAKDLKISLQTRQKDHLTGTGNMPLPRKSSRSEPHATRSRSTSFQAATSLMFLQAIQKRPDFPNGRRVSAPFNVSQIGKKCREENDNWLRVFTSVRSNDRGVPSTLADQKSPSIALSDVVKTASKAAMIPPQPPAAAAAVNATSKLKRSGTSSRFCLTRSSTKSAPESNPAGSDTETCDTTATPKVRFATSMVTRRLQHKDPAKEVGLPAVDT